MLSIISQESVVLIECFFFFFNLSCCNLILSFQWKHSAEDEYKWLRAKRRQCLWRLFSRWILTKGEKADGISLTYGKLLRVTQPDQCPHSLFSPFASLWGTFNAETCACLGNQEVVEHLKMLTDVWESVLRGLLVSAFDVRDWRTASQGFSYCCIFLHWLLRECKKQRFCDVEDPAQMLHMLLPLWQTFCIHAVDAPPLCSVTKVSGWKYLIKSLCLICDSEFHKDKRAGSTCLTYIRHNKEDVRVSRLLHSEICRAWKRQRQSLISQKWV